MNETQVEEVYLNLGKRIGWCEDSKVTPKIFKLLLTLEQAQLAEVFPAVPEELAAKTGRSLDDVNKDLQYMYKVGVGTPSARSGKWNLPRNYMLFVDKICTHHRNFPGGDFRPLLNELNDECPQSLPLQGREDNPLSQYWERGRG